MKKRQLKWTFPRERSHEGLPFGNAVNGFLVWGGGSRLCVTVGRADLWDHRGGYPWTHEQSYVNIRAALESGDVKQLDSLFRRETPAGEPSNPYLLSLGHVAFDLGQGVRLDSAELDLNTGVASVYLVSDSGASAGPVQIALTRADGTLALAWPCGLKPAGHVVPAWEHEKIRSKLENVSFTAPVLYGDADAGGFAWELPADQAVSLAFATSGSITAVTADRGADAAAARQAAARHVSGIIAKGFEPVRACSAAQWADYWSGAPEVDIPDDAICEIHDFGMYQFGAMTDPAGIPAPLQGPWVEEYQLPPWNGDYHFNINVQMCYWPAYHGNKLAHLMPLFRMIKRWWPRLRENAKQFVGIDDGFMLPHSVDDRGVCIGGFWTGTIDHGCTAWVAQMMFRYVTYSGDLAFLKTDAYPFMKGAMKVYRAMMEERDGKLTIAATTSPEWWGEGPPGDAWGRDASFQLACAHRLARDLIRAAAFLGEEPEAMWRDVEKRLPLFSTAEQTSCIGRGPLEIGLFDGKRLFESHRHHSHMAGLVPFDTIDYEDQDVFSIVRETYTTWIQHGSGLWSGWSMPWASMLHTRIGQADAAELMLKLWKRVFTNEGHGSRHNAYFPGYSLQGKHPFAEPGDENEIMQMDGAMAATAAVQEMLVHERNGVVRLFAGAPLRWRTVSFRGMLVEGGFLVSASRVNGTVVSITVTSRLGGTLKIESPWSAEILERVLAPDETQTLTAQDDERG